MRKGRTAVLAGVYAAVLSGLGGIAHASLVASDQVSNNPPYTGYNNFNGLNGGSGFGPWNASNVSGSSGGNFMWNNVDLTTPGAGQGFDIYDNGTQASPTPGAITDEYAAIRPFTGALASGQDFSFIDQINNGSNPTNGGPSNLGFSLEDSTGHVLFDFHTQGGAAGYYLTDATQTLALETNVPYNYHAIDTYNFTLNNAATGAYTFTVSGTPPSYNPSGPPLALQTFTGTISPATGGISQVAIYNNNGGGGSDIQFDNLSITNVPEPISAGMVMVGLTALATRRRRVK